MDRVDDFSEVEQQLKADCKIKGASKDQYLNHYESEILRLRYLLAAKSIEIEQLKSSYQQGRHLTPCESYSRAQSALAELECAYAQIDQKRAKEKQLSDVESVADSDAESVDDRNDVSRSPSIQESNRHVVSGKEIVLYSPTSPGNRQSLDPESPREETEDDLTGSPYVQDDDQDVELTPGSDLQAWRDEETKVRSRSKPVDNLGIVGGDEGSFASDCSVSDVSESESDRSYENDLDETDENLVLRKQMRTIRSPGLGDGVTMESIREGIERLKISVQRWTATANTNSQADNEQNCEDREDKEPLGSPVDSSYSP